MSPSKEEGGWLGASPNHPRIKAWDKLYKKYQDYIICSARNNLSRRAAEDNDLPIDVVITMAYDAKGATKEHREEKLLRFVIFEPLPESQKGLDVFKESGDKTKKVQ